MIKYAKTRYGGAAADPLTGLAEVERRAVELDGQPTGLGPCADLRHFVSTFSRITSQGTPQDVRGQCVSPADADGLLGSSRLLARLAESVPEIVAGPLRLESQYWVGARKPSWLPGDPLTPTESAFTPVSEATATRPRAKPFGAGLFTSTGVLGTYGMWRIYLDLHRWSTLHPLPWHTHAVEPHRDVIVHEITSASDWVAFVLSHPRREGDFLYPDWGSVASRYDAVHMALRAIAATQGLYFPTERGIVDAPYWDIESTLWLRWCFSSTKLVETVT